MGPVSRGKHGVEEKHQRLGGRGGWVISIKVKCHRLWAGGSAWGDLGQEMAALAHVLVEKGY